MLKITYEINGRKISLSDISNIIEKMILEQVTKQLEEKIGSCKCSVHNQEAEITLKGKSINDFNYVINGCCEEFMQKIENILNGEQIMKLTKNEIEFMNQFKIRSIRANQYLNPISIAKVLTQISESELLIIIQSLTEKGLIRDEQFLTQKGDEYLYGGR